MNTNYPDRMTKDWWEKLYSGAIHTNQLLASDVRQLQSVVDALHRRIDDAMTQEVSATLGELRDRLDTLEARQDKSEQQHAQLIERLTEKFGKKDNS